MDISQAHTTAKLLVEAHGLQAEVEAARRLQEVEESGDAEKIEMWRRIRALIREMKPPHQG